MLFLKFQNPTKWAYFTLIFLYTLASKFQLNNGAALNSPGTNVFLKTNQYKLTLSQNKNELILLNENNGEGIYMKLAAMKNDEKVNLTAITWAHAVNSQRELNEALNSDINMIEADIVLGKLNNAGPDLPVMGHPPETTSDITLEEFLALIMAHNIENSKDTKGIKLDFKSIEVFEGSLDILNQMIPLMFYPIWLNADILSGPVNQTNSVPVDPDRFFAGCANFDKTVLSIGWTTRWGANYTDGAYSNDDINGMLEAIKMNNVISSGQPITFPVRAGIAANSIEQLHDLVGAVNDTNESSLTIWSSENDYVNVEKLRQLIFSFGFHRVYLDVPDELANSLDLGRDNGKVALLPSLGSFGLVSACMVLISMWLKRS